MKVLLVNGSPHKNGCTHTALGLVADVLHEEGIETEEFWIGIKPIGGCIACHQCDKRHDCVFDDAVNVFRKKALEADGFLFWVARPLCGSCGEYEDVSRPGFLF